ncbi:hypothetical protein CC86DRAFT_426836 [Ophiobolus disseminans]|uniref:Protein kinase domain-containing protein n=1 Tax=Ophiobolus disseminans TaxID=1469910 RepID=A0A6A6ZLF8_9PLEO|nr:hypothetical protein CC86DRAFT_426836 [Ophiobolus disseminans]
MASTYDFEERAGFIFDLHGAEQVLYESGTLANPEHFRKFAVAFKLARSGDDPLKWEPCDPEDTVFCWHRDIKTNPAELDGWLEQAENTPDPRLDVRNFTMGKVIRNYVEVRITQHKDVMTALVNFAIGLKICHPELRDYARCDERILAAFKPRLNAVNCRFIRVGIRHKERFEQMRKEGRKGAQTTPVLHVPPRRRSDENVHLYDESNTPPPTDADVDFVNTWSAAHEERPKGSRWVFERSIFQNENHNLAAGGQSQRVIHLFALISEEGHIERRMVVKIIGEETSATVLNDLQLEAGYQLTLTERGCPHILAAYGSAIRERDYSPHLGYIYMEYAPYDDLEHLLEDRDDNSPQIPEPAIWLTIRALAKALYTCQTGYTISKSAPEDEDYEPYPNTHLHAAASWNPLFNPDIKPGNIVLGTAFPTYYPAYKPAKIIDWGITFVGNIYGTPGEKIQIGTDGFHPPDQFVPVDGPYANTPIDLKSMTFNVGLVIMALMERHMCYTTSASYTAQQLRSDDRPGVWELLYFTRKGLEIWEKVYGDVKGEEVPRFAELVVEEEEFKVGGWAPIGLGGTGEEGEEEGG